MFNQQKYFSNLGQGLGSVFLASQINPSYGSGQNVGQGFGFAPSTPFGSVMSNLSGNITQNAAMGIIPGNMPSPATLTPNQIAAMKDLSPKQISALSAGTSRNAPFGMSGVGGAVPGMTLTPGQIAAQMSMAGPMSLLPYLGNSFLPKLIFPVAGLWSLFDGLRAYSGLKRDARASVTHFDPQQLAYYDAVAAQERLSEEYGHLGPVF